MTALGVAGCWLFGSLAAQEPDPIPPVPATALHARFLALAPDRRAEVLRALERRLRRTDDDALQRVVSEAKGRSAYPPRPQPRWFSPAEFAPTATARSLLGPGDAGHRTATQGMARETLAGDLTAGVVYDWATATIVQEPSPLTDAQVFANLVAGYPPGSDEAIARVLAALDNDPEQRRLGTWFGHLYADRDGRVFAEVTLYDAWRSGRTIEMPDTDAIAFARQVLGTRSFTAPLPADRRRERLYEKMREAFAAHREYRTLRAALATTFVTAAPALDPAYQSLIPRCHWLWAACGNDPRALADRLARAGDRSALLHEIDAAMASDAVPATRRAAELAEVAASMRALAEHEIARGSG